MSAQPNPYEGRARAHKVGRLIAVAMQSYGDAGTAVAGLVAAETEVWLALALRAEVNPPSETTKAEVLAELHRAGRRRGHLRLVEPGERG